MTGVTRFNELVVGLDVTGAEDADAKTSEIFSCKDQ